MYWNFGGVVVGSGEGSFGKVSGAMSVEIGFGNGEFLQHLAASRPNSLAIGIEVSQWCAAKGARRALKNGLDNVRILCGDARHLLKHAFEPHSVNEIFMNFPCPWPKRRHAERRVARVGFADLVASRLSPGGTFTLATDVDWYARQTEEIFAAHGAFETSPAARNGEREYATKYERKWRAMGRDIFELRATRRDLRADDGMAEEEDDSMDDTDIAVPAGAGDFRERVARLGGQSTSGALYKAMFREVYFEDASCALVKVISVDEGFEQHYYLKITERDGRLRATPDSVGHPYKTPGVRASAKLALELARGQD